MFVKKIRPLFLIALALGLALTACAPAATPVPATEPVEAATSPEVPTEAPVQNVGTLKIAVLPIIDTLPMYVAEAEGLFAKHGVTVEFVPVASAPERDQLLAAGQADGTVNETLSVMLFNKDAVQMQAVRYALRPMEGYGHFSFSRPRRAASPTRRDSRAWRSASRKGRSSNTSPSGSCKPRG